MIPMKPATETWTDEQWQAIYQTGTNILVSAGAGSGKTAVLTERIIEKLKQGISISSLVVLTFTKAAAFEMKTRVRKKIKKEIEQGNVVLKKELERLDSAFITTFDSYSLSLVKKYHYLLGVKKDISITDNIVLELAKKKLIDQVFETFYQKEDTSFLTLLDTFTTKDDDQIKTFCLKLNDSLETLTHKRDFLDSYLETQYQENMIEEKIKQYEQILDREKIGLLDALSTLKNCVSNPVSLEFTLKLEANLEPIYSCATYDDYKTCSAFSFTSFTRSKKIDEQELETMKYHYYEIKKHFERIKELCVYESRSSLRESILKTKETVSVFIAILKEFDEKLFAYKKRENLYEFSDIARLAIILLENHPEIREHLKRSINEIMIDEYQDTNDIGDYFISLISNQNVYMVGDIKQSIYRFRNANPNIFMEKYSQYQNHIGGEKIDLNKNFRSRREVLDDINFLFQKFMDETIGGADYKNGHAMIFGNTLYEKSGATIQNNHFEILDYEYHNTELSKFYKTDEIEAFIIADDIKKKIENHYQVFDKEEKVLRSIQYQDISILLDRKTSFDLYQKIFTYLGIPIQVHKDEKFAYSDEVFVIQNILKWVLSILEPQYAMDHLSYAVLSVSRSIVGGISDEILFQFLLEHKENLLKTLNESKTPLTQLHEKMCFLAQYSKTHTLSELLEQVYQVFDLYKAILKLQNIELLTIKLDYLLDVARNLEQMGYQIASFLEYLEEAIKGDLDVTFSRNQDTSSNAVNIMTIHKSKGLEYHVCYYAGLQKKFSKADLKDKFLFDQKLGFLVPYFEEGIRETFYKELLKEEWNKEDISEKIRVFYVALSRAKEKMILVTNLSDKELERYDHDMVDEMVRRNYQSFFDILLSIKPSLKPYLVPTNLADIPISKQYEQLKEVNYAQNLEKTNIKPNYITLDIKPEKIEKTTFSESYHVLDQKEKERLNFGLKIHECLQYLDFRNIEESLASMHLSMFEKQKLLAFCTQDFMKNLKSPTFYHELELYNEKEDSHGIIDLLIVDLDVCYIVDYKLKNIDKPSYVKQVSGYAKMVEHKLGKKVVGILYSLLEERYQIVLEGEGWRI